MDIQKMVEEIKESIADKTLSFGCQIKYFDQGKYDICYEGFMIEDGLGYLSESAYSSIYSIKSYDKDHIEILGHHVSLPRVLSALSNASYEYDIKRIRYRYSNGIYDDIRWDLLKKNGSDAYLQDQSYETIQALHGLLVR